MSETLFTGDLNFMNVTDGSAPFRRVAELLGRADAVFSNLECSLYAPETSRAVHHEGFHADPVVAIEALRAGSITAVGIANNVNYGTAIMPSVRALDAAGIPHSGAGEHREAAQQPVIVERAGRTYGFLQRTSVYWPINHEAQPDAPGVAVMPGHTAYEAPMYRFDTRISAANRPGIPATVITWPDAAYLDQLVEQIADLRTEVDILIASFHWGLKGEVLTYMRTIAHAAIEAGADVVMGHGPHQPLALGFHLGKPIFYGLGSFSFHTGHRGGTSGDWVGLLGGIDFGDPERPVSLRFVRHNDANETQLREVAAEVDTLDSLIAKSAEHGARLAREDDRLLVTAI